MSDPTSPHISPQWLIVVPTKNGVGTFAASKDSAGAIAPTLWDSLEAITQARRDVRVCVVDSYDGAGDSAAYASVVGRTAFTYLHLPANDAVQGMGFNLARAWNVGAATCLSAALVCFLHDDVEVSGSGESKWLDRLAAALGSTGVGLAVPTLTGDCGNPLQGLTLPQDLAFSHSAEYVGGCVLAVRREMWHDAGCFAEALSGYEWAQVALQHALAKRGLATVVVPVEGMHHAGGGTYDRAASAKAFEANVKKYCELTGCGLEYKARPDQPRIAPQPDSFSHQGCTDHDSLCFVVDSAAGLQQARKMWDGMVDEQRDPCDAVLVDAAPSKEAFDALAGTGIRYYAQWDDDLVRQAIGSAAFEDVVVYDLRAGHALPVVAMIGRRIRLGAHYDLPQRLDTLEVGLWKGAGLGDTVMLGPALTEFKRQYPKCRIKIHHCWEAGLVLSSHPAVDEVIVVGENMTPPIEMFNAGKGTGSEGTTRQMFVNLGVAPEGADGLQGEAWERIDRRLRHYFLPGEREKAVDQLFSWLPPGAEAHTDYLPDAAAPVVVGVQAHGGWQSKRWNGTNLLVQKCVESGWTVVLIGNDTERTLPVYDHRRVLTMAGCSIREMVAVLNLCDIVVGFDSGVIYSASAWKADRLEDGTATPLRHGTSTLSLWGPHNPHYLLHDGQPVNADTVRAKTPMACHAEHGFSCRSGAEDKQSGGSQCPLREGPGADCLDIITACDTAEHIDSMEGAFWGRPIRERW